MPLIELPSLRVLKVAAVQATERLAVVNRDPGPSETGVPLDSAIKLDLVDVGPDGIDSQATRVWFNDVLAFDGSIQQGFDGPRTGSFLTTDTLQISLNPAGEPVEVAPKRLPFFKVGKELKALVNGNDEGLVGQEIGSGTLGK